MKILILILLGWTFVFNAELREGMGYLNNSPGAEAHSLIVVYPSLNTAYWYSADGMRTWRFSELLDLHKIMNPNGVTPQCKIIPIKKAGTKEF